MEPIYQGWTPPVYHRCTRCGQDDVSPLVDLCDDCHEHDALECSPELFEEYNSDCLNDVGDVYELEQEYDADRRELRDLLQF